MIGSIPGPPEKSNSGPPLECVDRREPEIGARAPERIPVEVVVLLHARPARRGEVDAPESPLARPLQRGDRRVDVPCRDVHETEQPFGISRAEVGEPPVVDVVRDRAELELVAPHRAEADADPRQVLAVLAEVPHQLGGNSVGVHVGEPGLGVVVAGALDVGVLEPRAEHRRGARFLAPDERVELLEVSLRAVLAELVAQFRSDVRVARHDDEGCVGIHGRNVRPRDPAEG